MTLDVFKKYKIPAKPGVYFFLKGKEILYIGKATSLKDRVRSYLAPDLIATRGPLLVELVFKADQIKWEETESVLEALILEANLIKKHLPHYNTKEKDNKSFNFVAITKEDFPKVLVLRERNLKNLPEEEVKFQAKYGPFTNGGQLKEAMRIIRPIFPYLDQQSSKGDNLKFYQQIGLAPETATPDAKVRYKENIKNLKLFFEGKKKRVILNFKKEMKKYAKELQFEKAGEMRKRIFALEHINDVALLKNDVLQNKMGETFRIEAYDVAHMSGKNMVGVMTVVENNQAIKSEYKKFKIRTQAGSNDTGALAEVLKRRLAHPEWNYPNLIIVDGGIAQINVANKLLKGLNLNIPVVSVLKDERHKPKALQGDGEMAKENKNAILLANSEAHRFAIAYHKNMRNKNFLTK